MGTEPETDACQPVCCGSVYIKCSWHFGFGCDCTWLTCGSKNVITRTRYCLTLFCHHLCLLYSLFVWNIRGDFIQLVGRNKMSQDFCQVLCCPEHKRCPESVGAWGLWYDWNSLKISEFELRWNCRYGLITPFYNCSESYIKCFFRGRGEGYGLSLGKCCLELWI